MRIAALVGSFAAGLFIGVFLGTLATKEEKPTMASVEDMKQIRENFTRSIRYGDPHLPIGYVH